MQQGQVVVIGHSAWDSVYRIAAFGEKPSKHRALEHIECGGGSAANAAVAIARMGDKAKLWSRVGADEVGHKVVEQLMCAGVDAEHILVHEGSRTSTAVVIVDGQGERFVVSERDHAMPAIADWLPLDDIGKAGAVLSDMTWREATCAAFRSARLLNVPTVLDIDVAGGLPSSDVLEFTDFAIASAGALEALIEGRDRETRLQMLITKGARHAGVTLGSEGYVWRNSDGNSGFQPAFDIEIVDTTGAGDAFHGAFACGLAHHWDDAECARVAAAVAALKCRRLGARAALPSKEELQSFLREKTGRGLSTNDPYG